MSRTEITPRPSNGHPVTIQRATKVFKFLTLTVWCDTTDGLWELRELRTSGPVARRGLLVASRLTDKKASKAILEMMSVIAKDNRPDGRPAEQMTIQEHAARLCEEYEALFEAPGQSDHPVTQDEERHTATVMHMILPHLASQIRNL